MIILFNLNRYVGGGEVILIRHAEYLKQNNIDYRIISFKKDCYISRQSKVQNLNFIEWPSKEDSLIYMSQNEKNRIVGKILDSIDNFQNVKIFTYCMRDVYNVNYIFSRSKKAEICFSTGIYHAEDFKYLSSLTCNKKEYISFNKNIIRNYERNNAVFFLNKTGKDYIFKGEINNAPIIPIPINVAKEIPEKSLLKDRKIKIVSISRFVVFKIAAILSIIRFTQKNKNFELTLIGNGPFDYFIKIIIRIWNMKNIKILNNLRPDQLDEVIDKADIGYAQGTSILEISKRGIPVIIAPYGRLIDIFKKDFKCLGVFGFKDNFNYGDQKDDGSNKFNSLNSIINDVVTNYGIFSKIPKSFIYDFSSKNIFHNKTKLIMNSKQINSLNEFKLPKRPIIKFFLRKIIPSFNKN